jgi:hypothetical protein
MQETAKVEGASPGGLQDLAEDFARWRETRRRGEHVPPALWAEAVRMAHKHGAPQIAQELQLDVDRLRERMRRAAEVRAPSPPRDRHFVELLASAMPAAAATTTAPSARECVVELRNAPGATMRVELAGNGLSMLAGLCREFCGA